MMSKRIDFGGSRDLISGLPEALIGHILSFLPTKEAASTSVLAKNWRYLFALTPILHFDETVYVNPLKEEDTMELFPSTSFMDFVDRVLALQGNSPVHKFSIYIKNGVDPEYGVDPVRIVSWILNVLERGVSYLDLCMNFYCESPLPSKMFLSETLVTIKLQDGPTIDVENVYLPKLKTLCIESVEFVKEGIGLSKLLSGCPVLEDLVLNDICWNSWESSSVSVTTLKRFKFNWEEREYDENPKSVSFDTKNLVYLEYSENIADKYPKVNFDSLVEARLGLRMTVDQIEEAYFEEENMVGNATDLMMGLCNVKILYLFADTLQILNNCCEAIPRFNSLTHLTIESSWRVGWQSLPGLLKNSPNLETLVLLGLIHRTTNRCGDVCLCNRYEDEDEEEEEEEVENHTCLSSSPVKVLKIMKFGETYDDEIWKKVKLVKHFLKTMPNLEQLILYYDRTFDEDVIEVSSQLQGIPRVASSRCNVQVISDHLSLSSIVPSSVSMNWAALS